MMMLPPLRCDGEWVHHQCGGLTALCQENTHNALEQLQLLTAYCQRDMGCKILLSNKMNEHQIIQSFIEASSKLGFAFSPKCELKLNSGKLIQAMGLVHEFGSVIGTLILNDSHNLTLTEQDELRAKGYFMAQLYASYAQYEEELFKNTLNDWQYFGLPTSQPHWYSGESWSRLDGDKSTKQ
jgi:hypothetical protein